MPEGIKQVLTSSKKEYVCETNGLSYDMLIWTKNTIGWVAKGSHVKILLWYGCKLMLDTCWRIWKIRHRIYIWSHVHFLILFASYYIWCINFCCIMLFWVTSAFDEAYQMPLAIASSADRTAIEYFIRFQKQTMLKSDLGCNFNYILPAKKRLQDITPEFSL